MSNGMNCNGVIVPWSEYFFKGYSLDKVKALLTDREIICRVSTIYARGMNMESIKSFDMMSDKGTRYKRYEGHPHFFNSTYHTASINLSFIYDALGTALKRAFENDESDDAEMFDRHIRKVANDWLRDKMNTQEHKDLYKKIENKIIELNQVGWDILKRERENF